MKNVFKAAILSTALVGVAGTAMATPEENLAENAMAVSDFSTLVAAATATGLVNDLMGDGPYTIFAPTNEAFAALGTPEELLMPENLPMLNRVLQAHIVPGMYTSDAIDIALLNGTTDLSHPADVVDGVIDFDTLSTTNLLLDKTGSYYNVTAKIGTDSNAQIVMPDIIASNGVIHAIDKVLTVN